MTANASELVSVTLPRPWWTSLTYSVPPDYRKKITPGVRAKVLLGHENCIGVITGTGVRPDSDFDGEIKELSEVIDAAPVIGEYVMPLLEWFCDAYLCGMGTAMKTLLPDGFLKGQAAEAPRGAEKPEDLPPVEFVYEPEDAPRLARYLSMLADGRPSLVIFPIYTGAKKFFELLSNSDEITAEIKERAILYPRVGGNSEWRAWRRLSAGEGTIIVGGQNAVMPPLSGLSRIIVEDESSHAWRSMRPPVFNARSLLASRARIEGAALVLGGRMPSPKAFLKYDAAQQRVSSHDDKKIIFVDMKLAYKPSVEGVSDRLAVSEPLIRETESAANRGEWALWILDRKGYAGEIICDECGAPLKCARCGGTLRLEDAAAAVCCVSCGVKSRTPENCPNCAGHLLSARRPGLEALFPLADAAITDSIPIFSPNDSDEKLKNALRGKQPGIAIGTRTLLALCDEVPVGMVAWIDADGEARLGEHDARTRAFSLIWESRWRGLSPKNRQVLIQTRRPDRDWQRGLGAGAEGWRLFWRAELKERMELSMPPYMSLIKIETTANDIAAMSEKFAEKGYEFWAADETDKKPSLWVRTKKLSELRRSITPFFHIRRARRGFPSIEVWHE